MNRKFILCALAVTAAVVVSDSAGNYVFTNSTGAPAGHTGAAADNGGKSCATTGCHAGASATPVTGWIAGPAGGKYVPGTTYTIVCTATQAGVVRFGFQAAALDLSGNQQGTIIVTNSTETQLTGGSKYITHTVSGTAGTDTRSWSFQWTAPGPGAGFIGIYAAFNCTNNSGSNLGDKIYTSSLILQETASAVDELSAGAEIGLRLFPMPVADDLTLSYTLQDGDRVEAELFDMGGRMVRSLLSENRGPGEHAESFQGLGGELKSGVYFLKLGVGERAYVQKIVVQ